MTSRHNLPQRAIQARDSLVAILDAEGEPKTELIAQRTRVLLRWKPNGADRDQWLYSVLPEQRHVRRAIRSLRPANGGQAGGGRSATTTSGTPDTGDRAQGGGSRRRQSPTRRHRRT